MFSEYEFGRRSPLKKLTDQIQFKKDSDVMLTPIRTLKSSARFRSVISVSEILQISSNTVSIISARTGFCTTFYYLPRIPRHFSISPSDPTRFLLTYPSTQVESESLVLLETSTGKVLKQFNHKSTSQTYSFAVLGAYIFFTLSSSPLILLYSQFIRENTLAQFELPFVPVLMKPSQNEAELLIVEHGGRAAIIGQFDEQGGPKLLHEVTLAPFSFVSLNGQTVTYGSKHDGQISILNFETKAGSVKTIETPHSSVPIGATDTFGVTNDGLVFSLETSEVVSNVLNPQTVEANGPTLVVFGKKKIYVFESTKRPVCSLGGLQPPEPFTAPEFSAPAFVMFASPGAVYAFNIALSEISKFASVQERITKIVTSNSIVSMVYDANSSYRLMTFVMGTKKRDEPGIDVCADHQGRHWILQHDAVLGFTLKGITLDQFAKLDLPDDHSYDRIFRIGATIGLYGSSSSKAAFLDAQRQFVSFLAPGSVTLIQFPAFCTHDTIFICQKGSGDLSDVSVRDYIRVDASVKSCCWLAQTLFAVEDRKIIAIGSRSGKKRILDSLPNAMCAIAAAFPSVLIFVTTIPENRLITVKQPFLSNVAVVDLDDSDLEAFRYMLSYMPRLPVDPHAVASLSPMFAMAVFNKSRPKFVDDDVIRIYSRFARFMELQNLVRETRGGPDVLRRVADAAKRIGQFEIARQLYEEIGAHEDLFTLFVLTRHAHNLGVLAHRSSLARPIEAAFGIGPKASQYETLPNLQLPRIRSPHVEQEFTLYAGDPSESSPLFPPSFDELNDFGFREFALTGEEVDAAVNAPIYEPPAPTEPVGESAHPEPPKTASAPSSPSFRPPPVDDTDMTMGKFFDDEPDEPKVPTITFEFKPPDVVTRKRTQTLAARRPFKLETSSPKIPAVNQAPVPSEAPVLPPVLSPSRPMGSPTDETNEEEGGIPEGPEAAYTSSLFL